MSREHPFPDGMHPDFLRPEWQRTDGSVLVQALGRQALTIMAGGRDQVLDSYTRQPRIMDGYNYNNVSRTLDQPSDVASELVTIAQAHATLIRDSVGNTSIGVEGSNADVKLTEAAELRAKTAISLGSSTEDVDEVVEPRVTEGLESAFIMSAKMAAIVGRLIEQEPGQEPFSLHMASEIMQTDWFKLMLDTAADARLDFWGSAFSSYAHLEEEDNIEKITRDFVRIFVSNGRLAGVLKNGEREDLQLNEIIEYQGDNPDSGIAFTEIARKIITTDKRQYNRQQRGYPQPEDGRNQPLSSGCPVPHQHIEFVNQSERHTSAASVLDQLGMSIYMSGNVVDFPTSLIHEAVDYFADSVRRLA